MMENSEDLSKEVSRYSVVVGFILIVVFVVPCVLFALLAKFFQTPDGIRRRSSTVRSLVGSLRISMDTKEEGLHRTNSTKKQVDSDSSGYGTFGLVEIAPDQLNCIEKIVTFKAKLACIETWKSCAPMALEGCYGNKKIITIRRLGSFSFGAISERDHSCCLRAELESLCAIPTHHLMLNLLGVCVSGSTGVPHAVMLEYPIFGSLHTFLICKRRGKVFGSTNTWGGLQLDLAKDKVVFALPESDRESLSCLLDNPSIRRRPFHQMLKEPICDVDQLLFALQIVHGLQFLSDNGIYHKRLSSENVVISHGFYLKLTGVDFDPPSIHQSTAVHRLKRTASGRNLLKWDAPEVIDSNEYSEKSEVWRFGMTMWEIASLGDAPFTELPNRIMAEVVKKGQKPSLPDGCSQEMYSVMEYCWNLDVHERPNLSQVIQRINDHLKTQDVHQLSLDLTSDSSTSSVQTATSAIDCHSPTYWTPTTPKEMKLGRGSFKRPHPSLLPAQPSATHRRLIHRPSLESPSTPSEDQLLFVLFQGEESRFNSGSANGYQETDV